MSERAATSPQALLTGPILPKLLRFALPNMGAMLATALAAIAETAYVGRFGSPALAGMALVFPFVMFQMMLSAGAMGGGVSSAVTPRGPMRWRCTRCGSAWRRVRSTWW